MKLHHRLRITSFQIILLGFAGMILLGALLLFLPFSARPGEQTSFTGALFTSTSAVCVTGLIVYDTAAHWSGFGQAVILLLIQIGGMGVVTLVAWLSLLLGKKIGLFGRDLMKESVAASQLGGITRLVRFIARGLFAVEGAGALLLLPVFCRDHGWRGIWLAVFHAVSAFCNAGFDLTGNSLVPYLSDPYLNAVIMLLIVAGGIGFRVWDDLLRHGFRLRRYRPQSRLVLRVSALLILLPAVFFFFFEYSALPLRERILASLFQSVTARTAGFNTTDLSAMSETGRAMMIPLMLIGGSPGSTAGGLKTTTFAVLIASAFAVFRRKDKAEIVGRSVDHETVKNASALLLLYLLLFLAGGVAISLIERLPLGICLFETASAVGTVGVSAGITGSLGTASRIILILLMYFGRVGGLTALYAAGFSQQKRYSRLPSETFTIG